MKKLFSRNNELSFHSLSTLPMVSTSSNETKQLELFERYETNDITDSLNFIKYAKCYYARQKKHKWIGPFNRKWGIHITHNDKIHEDHKAYALNGKRYVGCDYFLARSINALQDLNHKIDESKMTNETMSYNFTKLSERVLSVDNDNKAIGDKLREEIMRLDTRINNQDNLYSQVESVTNNMKTINTNIEKHINNFNEYKKSQNEIKQNLEAKIIDISATLSSIKNRLLKLEESIVENNMGIQQSRRSSPK